MASWLPFPLPSSIQKRFLSYVLSKVGIFDDASLDLDNLNLTLGRQNIVELKDVALDAAAISTKAGLPSSLQIKSGKISLLRLMVPADIYKSGIVIDAVGVRISLRYQEEDSDGSEGERARTHGQSPAHRKTTRRIPSPARRRNRGQRHYEDDVLPTAQDLARSFLLEEPLEERQQLEASVAAHTAILDESVMSESSQGTEPGTGASLGVPTFLATFLTNVLDRVVVNVEDVQIVLDGFLPGASSTTPTLALQLSVANARIWSTPTLLTQKAEAGGPPRNLTLSTITLCLLTEPEETSEASQSLASSQLDRTGGEVDQTTVKVPGSQSFTSQHTADGSTSLADAPLQSSIHTLDAERFADAPATHPTDSQFDIRPGDDNISWGSRQHRQGPISQDLWDSVADEDDLPDSLLFDERRSPQPRTDTIHQSSLLDQSTPKLDSQSTAEVARPRPAPAVSQKSPDLRASPGSWPRMDRSTSNLSQTSSTSGSAQSMASAIDNKPSSPLVPAPEIPFEDSSSVDDLSLAQSRLFTHAEAESMYMSAMTQEVSASADRITMPGAWSAESHEYSNTAAMQSNATSEVNTPRAHSPALERQTDPHDEDRHARISTVLLTIDEVKMSLKAAAATPSSTSEHGRHQRAHVFPDATKPTYALHDRTTPRQESSLSTMSEYAAGLDASTSTQQDESTMSFAIRATSARFRADLTTLEILRKAGMALVKANAMTPGKKSVPVEQTASSAFYMELSVDNVSVDLAMSPTDFTSLASLRLDRLSLRQKSDEFKVQIGTLSLFLGNAQVLRFDHEHHSTDSAAQKPDIDISYSSAKSDNRNRVVPELSVHGQIVWLQLDLPELGESIEHIGSLSGILDMSSALSDHASPHSSAASKRASTSVRFTDDTPMGDSTLSVKANMRLAGIRIDLQGRSCGLSLRTSSVKAIQREQGISLSTATIELSQLPSDASKARNTMVANNVRLDLLTTPTDKDLEKFLALLTPSNDKYDNDSDILIETLIRQRKKGACSRLHVDTVNLKFEDFHTLAQLNTLSTDLGQLSAVTKYLPEDDRPGMLSMIRIKEMDIIAPTNPTFGNVKVSFQELQCAHVGLPALVAVALSNLTVTTLGGIRLIHHLLPHQGVDNLPMIMARMLGDELEPSLTVKLFNVCVEYSVPTLLGILNQGTDANTEHVVAELVNSIADLAYSTIQKPSMTVPPSTSTEKKTRIDLSIHSSAIGLTPLRLKSKALLVLTDSKLSMLAPPAETMEMSFEMKRAAMFVIDDIDEHAEAPVASRRIATNTTTDTRVADALARQGYTSVASIMAAKIDFHIHEAISGRTTEVDIRNELLLMETCADSTQTLIATLSALSPPAPPSKQAKYLTEPLSLEDMISSFSGETVTARQDSPDTLFDVENDFTSDVDIALHASHINDLDADDLLFDPEMTASIYGPVSGILGDMDDQDDDDRPPVEAAESLLEEDPFVMTVTPDDLPFSDSTLLKDLRQQTTPSAGAQQVDLGLTEFEDLAFDALGRRHDVLGDQRQFCSPSGSQPVYATDSLHSVVRVRLRDVHFIWNLHDGYDWQKTRDGITSAVEQVEQRAEERERRQSRNAADDEESVIGDFLFNSIYIGVPSTREAQDIRRQINRHIDDLASETESVPLSGMSRPTAYSTSGRSTQRPRRRLKLERGRSHKIAFELKGLSVDFSLFQPDASEVQSSVDVRVRGFEIFDNVPTSTWRKFLTLLNTGEGRELSKPMVHLELLNVKTIQNYSATEMVIRATLLPLRLHVDQDALDFITRFFEFKDDSKASSAESTEQPFLQRVEVDTVDLQLDYKPKKIDYAGLRSGHTTEFMNFIVLDAANIQLKHAIVYGVKGFEPLHKTLNDVWMPDVRRNQLPTVLAGLAPLRSLVNIGTGVRDVVAIPVREYKKDGRIFRSIQKGAFHFGKTTASELARLGAKVAIGTQNILTGAEELLSPTTSSPLGRASPSHRMSSDYGWHEVEEGDGDREKRAISAYANQPLGVLAGLASARRYLEHDLLTARDALIAVQGEVLNSNNPGAAAVAVARHAPTVILRPVIGASRAIGTALLGVGNQIDRDNIRRMEDKYKRR